MDGDNSARTLEGGASSVMNDQEFTSGIHEDSKPRQEPAGEKTTGAGSPLFSAGGAIGKQFTTEGAVGGTAQKIGGPLDKDGMIGKQFKETGSIGGAVEDTLGKGEANTFGRK
ncbi:hypothetical protein NA57DRAFT_62212 [Rhizodiscina lignyota]|uniref:Uncharacterized protein n=1 Tax=Rhizodiscina lignyota TaxID=1504668 RepID=A0A9P4I390_9PEZI|nr:hypothetical protein NA57DRAFT_62212 [Rhizodiscina lignyota]